MTTLKCPAGYIFVFIQFEDPVLIKFNYKKNIVTLSFISVLELIFFNSLSDFSANNFFYAYRVCKHFIFRPCKQCF